VSGESRPLNPQRRGRGLAALLVLAALVLTQPACERRARTSERCRVQADCAVGLLCEVRHCHRPGDPSAIGLRPMMVGLPRPAQAPREMETISEIVQAAAREVGSPVTADIFTSRLIPERMVAKDGNTYQPEMASRRLSSAVAALARDVEGFSLGRKVTLAGSEAAAQGLVAVKNETDIPIIVGAAFRAAERREPVPVILDANHVDYALAAGLWRLKRRVAGETRVAFLCVAGSFCPDAKPLAPAKKGAWSEGATARIREVEALFDQQRESIVGALRAEGIVALAMLPRGGVPPDAAAVVLAGPLSLLSAEDVAWVHGLRESNVGFIGLLPGARQVASSGRFAAVEGDDRELLAAYGISAEHALLTDKATRADFSVPGPGDSPPQALPLAIEAVDIAAAHEATGTLGQLALPLARSFSVPPGAERTVLYWARAAASAVKLPAAATAQGIDDATETVVATTRRALAVAIDARRGGRAVIIGSDLGLESMSAEQLLGKLLAEPPEDLEAALAGYVAAAKAYVAAGEAAAPLRNKALRALHGAVHWVGVPRDIRELIP
jgi:hypothetical protein